jgi:hypothetical protein
MLFASTYRLTLHNQHQETVWHPLVLEDRQTAGIIASDSVR